MTALRVDVNCDIGEGFGRWQMPHDEALMRIVTSVNVAAGFHAGDPVTVRRTVTAALAQGLDVGVHVALPDLLGFGRRPMAVQPTDLQDYCMYQIGAVAAFVRAEGGQVTHVKPHGALYVMASTDLAIARAVASATAAVLGEGTRLFMLDRRFARKFAQMGLHVVVEGFPELEYDDEGGLILEERKRQWVPEQVGARAVAMVRDHAVRSRGGKELTVRPATLCVHSDAPNAAAVAGQLVTDLRAAGVRVAPLSAP